MTSLQLAVGLQLEHWRVTLCLRLHWVLHSLMIWQWNYFLNKMNVRVCVCVNEQMCCSFITDLSNPSEDPCIDCQSKHLNILWLTKMVYENAILCKGLIYVRKSIFYITFYVYYYVSVIPVYLKEKKITLLWHNKLFQTNKINCYKKKSFFVFFFPLLFWKHLIVFRQSRPFLKRDSGKYIWTGKVRGKITEIRHSCKKVRIEFLWKSQRNLKLLGTFLMIRVWNCSVKKYITLLFISTVSTSC